MKRSVFNGKSLLFLLLILLINLTGPVTARSDDFSPPWFKMGIFQGFPAPWDLTADMYIIMMNPQPELINEDGFVPGYMESRYDAESSAMVILVKYKTSNVGPYNELMFIPGIFTFKTDYHHYMISKIYVDSWKSVVWGQKNWGIPKEFAHIEFNQLDETTEEIVVKKHHKKVATIKLEDTGDRFGPFNSADFGMTLGQHYHLKTYMTEPLIEGSANLANVIDWYFDPNYFPELDMAQISLVLKITDVNMYFPEATILFGVD